MIVSISKLKCYLQLENLARCLGKSHRHIIHLSVDMAVYVRCDVSLVMFVLSVGLVMITTVIAFNFFLCLL